MTVDWDKCFVIDDELDKLVSAGEAPKLMIIAPHYAAVIKLFSVGI